MIEKQRKKKAVILEGLDKYDFDKLSKSIGNFREKKRYLAFAHIKDGKNFTEVAKMMRVSLRTVMNWVRNFREKGIEALKDSFGGGAKPHVPHSDYEDFKQSVLELQKNRPGGRIRGKDIADLIRSKYGVSPSKSSVYETLKKAGLVWITGRSRHPKEDKEAQKAFKKTF
jgi:transposase